MAPAGSPGTASGPYRAEPPHIEGVDGLREEIRDGLGGWPVGSGYYQYTVGIDDAAEMADALLSGPLAPLLAKLRAVEELADPANAGPLIPAAAVRRALDAS